MTLTATTAVDFERIYDYINLDELPPLDNGYYYELVEGKLIVSPPPGGQHSDVSTTLLWKIFEFDPQRKLGRIFVTGRFEFQGLNVGPDLFYFVSERIPVFDQGAITIPADIAVEVWSRSDWEGPTRQETARTKVRSYLKHGFKLVWVLRPDNSTVEVYHQGSDAATQILSSNDILDGEDIIPGFKLKVSELFV